MRPNEVNSWKQAGRISLWRYAEPDRNNEGWHLAVDENGHESLVDLLRRFPRQGLAGTSSRTVKLTKPTDEVLAVPGWRHAKVLAPTRLRLSVGVDTWIVASSDDEVVLGLGDKRLAEVTQWLEDPARAFDTSIGENPSLCFWGTWRRPPGRILG